MGQWLVKSEPGSWSWEDQLAAGTTHWDGVRNAQALNNMKAMAVGDRVLFYHSGKDRQLVGLMQVAKAFYPDPEDPKSGLVDMKAERTAPSPVPLSTIKSDGRFNDLALVRQPRLSVMPVDDDCWAGLLQLAGLDR